MPPHWVIDMGIVITEQRCQHRIDSYPSKGKMKFGPIFANSDCRATLIPPEAKYYFYVTRHNETAKVPGKL